MKDYLRALHHIWSLFLLLVILVTACTRLPDYALPQQLSHDDIAASVVDGITYRALKRNDFRAKKIPGTNTEQDQHLGAKIVTRIRLAKASQFHFSSKRQQNQTMYHAEVEKIIFEAVMLPDYSWWNPKVSPFIQPYVLQHEQIHFALTELCARELCRDVGQQLHSFQVIDTTKEGVEKQLRERLALLLQQTLDKNLKRQLEFDQETSLYFDPIKQQEWFERVTARLQEINGEADSP